MNESKCTAGVADVEEGKSLWAMHPYVGEKAHYWTVGYEFEGSYWVESACGHRTAATERVPLLNPGNWPHCKLCEKRK